ncbi:hypothetical protein [Glaciibacter superstes]|uniref:hypothetical protein n=1 Tax=Glaciibacter superstes TaxID=501023 RepID=UPI0003B584CD|nr:hypothetical protein [Glaciibacter superstes]
MSEQHPELSGYEPPDERPLRSRRVKTAMRIIVAVGLVALVVPGILTTMNVASRTAIASCQVQTAHYYPDAVDFDARFEFAGAGGFGWQCYSIDRNERETFVVPLGIIPSAPQLAPRGVRT